jgi:hypothetical protein
MSSKDEVLVFVKPICKNTDQTYEYDLFFSDTPDIVWGIDWEVNTPGLVSTDEITPDSTTYNKVVRIKTEYPLKTVQETYCYSMEYAIARIIALSWIDIENMEEYPEKGRMVLYFGDTFEHVQGVLSEFGIFIKD